MCLMSCLQLRHNRTWTFGFPEDCEIILHDSVFSGSILTWQYLTEP